MTRTLVTGGAGFIGSHVAQRLLALGGDVRILDSLVAGSEATVREHCAGAELVVGDVREAGAVADALDGCDAIIHLAALGSVAASVADPLTSHATNVVGSINVLAAARAASVRRVVFASSCAVYGDGPEQPKRESAPPCPTSPYAADKLAVEGYCASFAAAYGLETVALRYFNVYGPRQDPASEYAAAIPRFISALLDHRAPTIFGDGEQSRDYVFVGDIAEATVCALDAPATAGRVYNVGSGRATTVNELVAELKALLGSDADPVHAPPRRGDSRHSRADISSATAELGYSPRVSLRDGLERAVAQLRDRLGAPAA